MGSATTYLIGIRDMEAKFSEMMEVKLFCEGKGVGYPKEVRKYFGDLVGEPESYIRSKMEHVTLTGIGGDGICKWATKIPIRECNEEDDDSLALEFSLEDLPEGLKALRLEMRW